jgi:hypothetical protein
LRRTRTPYFFVIGIGHLERIPDRDIIVGSIGLMLAKKSEGPRRARAVAICHRSNVANGNA